MFTLKIGEQNLNLTSMNKCIKVIEKEQIGLSKRNNIKFVARNSLILWFIQVEKVNLDKGQTKIFKILLKVYLRRV